MTLHTTFIINGGAGRVICAIPALEKFSRLNPTNDFKVVIHGWDSAYWSHPLLQNRTVGVHQKGVFESYIKNNRVVVPEPYFVHGYYNQQLSIAEAFDEEINHTSEHSDLTKPTLYLSSFERTSIRRIITELKLQHNKSKVVVFQPYGSSMNLATGFPYDTSHRSLDVEAYLYIAKKIPKDWLVIYFGPPELRHVNDNISPDLQTYSPDLRMFISLIHECDYFIGCDSVGQHIAYAFNKPGSIFMGSTLERNVTYPQHFKIFRKSGHVPVYNPIRFGGIDSEFTDRLNDGIMEFSTRELDKCCESINKDLAHVKKLSTK